MSSKRHQKAANWRRQRSAYTGRTNIYHMHWRLPTAQQN